MYFELDVATNDPYHAYGSCSIWSTIVSDVSISTLLYNPVSIQMRTVVADPIDINEYIDDVRSCNESAAVGVILDNLADGSTAGVTTQCGDNQWTVKLCPDASLPSVCVDCADPCLPTLHCEITTTSTQEALFSLSPCVPQTCADDEKSTAIRLLSVDHSPSCMMFRL